MPRKLRELRADLRRDGFSLARQEGSHEIWTHPLIPGVSANLAGKDGADAHSYQEKQVHKARQKLAEAKRMLKGKQP